MKQYIHLVCILLFTLCSFLTFNVYAQEGANAPKDLSAEQVAEMAEKAEKQGDNKQAAELREEAAKKHHENAQEFAEFNESQLGNAIEELEKSIQNLHKAQQLYNKCGMAKEAQLMGQRIQQLQKLLGDLKKDWKQFQAQQAANKPNPPKKPNPNEAKPPKRDRGGTRSTTPPRNEEEGGLEKPPVPVVPKKGGECQCKDWTFKIDLHKMGTKETWSKEISVKKSTTANGRRRGRGASLLTINPRPLGVKNGDLIAVKISKLLLHCDCTNGAVCNQLTSVKDNKKVPGVRVGLGENDKGAFGGKSNISGGKTGGGNCVRVQRNKGDKTMGGIVNPNKKETMQFTLLIQALGNDFRYKPFQYVELSGACSAGALDNCKEKICTERVKLEFDWKN